MESNTSTVNTAFQYKTKIDLPKDKSIPQAIKRYANRKLYWVNESQYITLEGLTDMVQNDIPFTVIDNATKTDITAATLLQTVFQKQVTTKSVFSAGVVQKLLAIIKSNKTLTEYLEAQA